MIAVGVVAVLDITGPVTASGRANGDRRESPSPVKPVLSPWNGDRAALLPRNDVGALARHGAEFDRAFAWRPRNCNRTRVPSSPSTPI